LEVIGLRSDVIALLTERLGADVVDALEGLMDERIRASAVTKDEYREILSRLDLLENNYQHLSGEVSELRRIMMEFIRDVDARFDKVNERIDKINDRIDERFDQLNARIDSMIRWTVGTVALFGVLISALMTILKLFG
jgi:tetrahydromethanopterin S-methyltransferase subunit G